ncbi:MAG: hydroxypyruvate isomerase family protein [Chthoniobacterales bacterium]
MNQSVSLPMFPNAETLLPQLAEIGYKGVEVWGRGENFPQLCQSARREGLQVCAMIGSARALNAKDEHAEAEAEIRESIDIATSEGISDLICFSGSRREGFTDAQGIETVVEGFSRVAAYAEEKEVTLLLELLNSKVDHPGYQADHTTFGVEVCRRVNSPRVRLLYDIYHMQIMEGDIIRTIRENIEWIGHFHTAGNPGRNDPDDQQELNYSAIAKTVLELNFPGFIGHEFSPKQDALAALHEAYTIWNRAAAG